MLSKKALHAELVAQAARTLTPKMVEALLWLPSDGSGREEAKNAQSLWGLHRRALVPGVEAYLAGRMSGELTDKGWIETPAKWRLTPFGMAVRSYVESLAAERA